MRSHNKSWSSSNCFVSCATSFSVICVVYIKRRLHAIRTLLLVGILILSTYVMAKFLYICVLTSAFIDLGSGISSKVDFDDDTSETNVNNTSNVENDDVEVKHTIVVATKLRNNNRRGIKSSSDDGTLTYRIGSTKRPRTEENSEVPIIMGYKGVDSTQLLTPDTRHKTPIYLDYPESTFVSRNIRDEYDVHPNLAPHSTQWKPSNFFNNINWYNQEYSRQPYNDFSRRSDTVLGLNQAKFSKRITNDGLKEFYCSKCREMSSGRGVGCPPVQQRSNPWLNDFTTQKTKLDGKLAKLN